MRINLWHALLGYSLVHCSQRGGVAGIREDDESQGRKGGAKNSRVLYVLFYREYYGATTVVHSWIHLILHLFFFLTAHWFTLNLRFFSFSRQFCDSTISLLPLLDAT